jgi:hypothetical protein
MHERIRKGSSMKNILLKAINARSRRVAVLVTITVMLGVLDLFLTTYCMGTIGLPESNPFARWLVGISPGLLVSCKLALIAINGGLLLAIAKRRSAEVGAWIRLCLTDRMFGA